MLSHAKNADFIELFYAFCVGLVAFPIIFFRVNIWGFEEMTVSLQLETISLTRYSMKHGFIITGIHLSAALIFAVILSSRFDLKNID